MDMNHTPTPWVAHGRSIEDPQGEHLATTYSVGKGKFSSSSDNAAFIVRAANSHDQLVAALKEIVESAKAADQGDIEAWAQELYECGKTARAALAAAGA